MLSLLCEVVTIICGFILPRLIMANYGSQVNGLVQSITQFLGLISLCELGVGAVVQSTLYKPLADHDEVAVSRIMRSSRKFFNKIGIILAVYVALLVAIYPLGQLDSFDYLFTAVLIGAMSISFFAQYFFGINNQLLVNADQKAYVQLFYQILTIILNTAVCYVLIRLGASIQLVKLSTSCIYLIRPLGLWIHVKRHYRIDKRIVLTEEPIKQKWNGLAQHFASVILNNTDTVVLTLFSTLYSVSVYNVYNLIVTGMRQIVYSFTRGVQALFGNMLAKDESQTLDRTFGLIEWGLHTITTLAFCLTGILIVPFVRVYTKGITDADYIVPLFAILITVAIASYCYRLPYSIMVLAAGHFKQTQWSAVVEMAINIVVSIVLVFFFDLIGVAIGTFVAMTYRTVYYAFYLRKNILFRSIKYFIKHIAVDVLTIGLIVAATFWIKMGEVSYIGWLFLALKVGPIGLGITVIVNLCCNFKQAKSMLAGVKNRFRLKSN